MHTLMWTECGDDVIITTINVYEVTTQQPTYIVPISLCEVHNTVD